jgi:hypothetical protein
LEAIVNGKEPDWAILVRYYLKRDEFSAVVDYLSQRERDPRNAETKIGNLMTHLAARGQQFEFAQLEGALKIFQEAGCGAYQRGRPLEQSRLEWDLSAREIAQEVLLRIGNEIPNVSVRNDESANGVEQPLETSRGAETPNGVVRAANDRGTITHSYQLRPGYSVSVELPANFTTKEANRLADFIRTLPFDSENS